MKVMTLLDAVLRAGGTAHADRDPSQDASRDGGTEFGDALRARLRETRRQDVPVVRAQSCTVDADLDERGVPFNHNAALLSGVVGVVGVEATLDGAAALAAPAVVASSEPSLLHTEPLSAPSITTITSATSATSVSTAAVSSAFGATVSAGALAPAAHSVAAPVAFSQAAGAPVVSTTQEAVGGTPVESAGEQDAAHLAARATATPAGLAPGAAGLAAAVQSASGQSVSVAQVPAEAAAGAAQPQAAAFMHEGAPVGMGDGMAGRTTGAPPGWVTPAQGSPNPSAPTDPQVSAGLALVRTQTSAAAADHWALTRVLAGDTGSAPGPGVAERGAAADPADASFPGPALSGPFSGRAGSLATSQVQPPQLGAGSTGPSAQAIGPHGAMAPGPVPASSDTQAHPHGAAGTPSPATLAGSVASAVLASVAPSPESSAAAPASPADATPVARADVPNVVPTQPAQGAQPAMSAAHVAPAASGHVPTPVPAQVVAAIAPVMMRRDGSYHVELQLDPASLGRLRVHVSIAAGEVVVQMVAAESSARDLLRQNMDQLRQQLADAGLDPTSLDVDDGSAWQDPRGQQQAREAALAREHSGGRRDGDTPPIFPALAGDHDRTVTAAHEANGPLDLHL